MSTELAMDTVSIFWFQLVLSLGVCILVMIFWILIKSKSWKK